MSHSHEFRWIFALLASFTNHPPKLLIFVLHTWLEAGLANDVVNCTLKSREVGLLFAVWWGIVKLVTSGDELHQTRTKNNGWSRNIRDNLAKFHNERIRGCEGWSKALSLYLYGAMRRWVSPMLLLQAFASDTPLGDVEFWVIGVRQLLNSNECLTGSCWGRCLIDR